MELKIDDKYYITSDKYNTFLSRVTGKKFNEKTKKEELIIAENWSCGSVPRALKTYIDFKERLSDAKETKELYNQMVRTHNLIEKFIKDWDEYMYHNGKLK